MKFLLREVIFMPEKLSTDVTKAWNEISEDIVMAAKAAGRNPKEITLMAVTKTVPPERVNEAIEAGCSLIGENKVQELLEKYGVKVDTVDISEIMKGKGALHCITAYLKRG